MSDNPPRKLDHIEADVKSHIVCSNLNRVCILHLLNSSPDKEMQAERMAYKLGLSHRTVLYHLDILHDYELVEVREFRKKGSKLLRSVWGLNSANKENLRRIFSKIRRKFDTQSLDKMMTVSLEGQRK